MESKFTITIKKGSILYFISVIPFVPIDYIVHIFPIYGTLCLYARIFFVLVYLYRLVVLRKNLTTPLVLAIVYFICCFLSTLLAEVNIGTLINYGIYLFGLILLIEDGFYFNVEAMMEGVLFWFEILVYANLLYFILNPNGYDAGSSSNFYFLGNHNGTMRKIFPGIILGGVQAFCKKNRITLRFTCMYLASLIFFLSVEAVTVIIGMLIFAIAILYFSFRGKSGIFKFEYFLIISVVLTILFAVIGQFSFAENIITGIFGKSMTLSSRTRIWEYAIMMILRKPIFGYGQLITDSTDELITGSDPHNMFLGVFFYGGIVGFAVLVIMLAFFGKKIHEDRKSNSPIVALFDAGFCAIFVMWCFEPYSNIHEFYKVYIFFVLAYHCKEFVECSKFNTFHTILALNHKGQLITK